MNSGSPSKALRNLFSSTTTAITIELSFYWDNRDNFWIFLYERRTTIIIKLYHDNQSYPIAKLSAISKSVHANSMESDRNDGLQKHYFRHLPEQVLSYALLIASNTSFSSCSLIP
jgi:hypothetical protein